MVWCGLVWLEDIGRHLISWVSICFLAKINFGPAGPLQREKFVGGGGLALFFSWCGCVFMFLPSFSLLRTATNNRICVCVPLISLCVFL